MFLYSVDENKIKSRAIHFRNVSALIVNLITLSSATLKFTKFTVTTVIDEYSR